MRQPTLDEQRAYVQRWRRLGPLLESFRRKELRALDDAKHLKIIDDLFDLARCGTPRTSSGLGELYRILAKAGK